MQRPLVFLLGAISLAAVVTGCANPVMVKISPDTYLLSCTDEGGIFGKGASAMKADVISRANELAVSQGKIAIPVYLHETPMYPGHFATIDYQFRVVDENETRQKMESWVGHQESDLASIWGAPTSAIDTRDGKRILTWESYWGQYDRNVCRKSFTIDKSGKIIRWSSSGCPF